MSPSEASVGSHPTTANYRDLAHVIECDVNTLDFLHTDARRVGIQTAAEGRFPVRLHRMLRELEADGLHSIASWQIHGRCFKIHNQTSFVNQVLPMWFRQTTFKSFRSQLRLFGFHRLETGIDEGAYYHEMFLKGKEFLAKYIMQDSSSKNERQQPANDFIEPDFYKMPPVGHCLDAHEQSTQNEPSASLVSFGGSTPSAAASGEIAGYAHLNQLQSARFADVRHALLSANDLQTEHIEDMIVAVLLHCASIQPHQLVDRESAAQSERSLNLLLLEMISQQSSAQRAQHLECFQRHESISDAPVCPPSQTALSVLFAQHPELREQLEAIFGARPS